MKETDETSTPAIMTQEIFNEKFRAFFLSYQANISSRISSSTFPCTISKKQRQELDGPPEKRRIRILSPENKFPIMKTEQHMSFSVKWNPDPDTLHKINMIGTIKHITEKLVNDNLTLSKDMNTEIDMEIKKLKFRNSIRKHIENIENIPLCSMATNCHEPYFIKQVELFIKETKNKYFHRRRTSPTLHVETVNTIKYQGTHILALQISCDMLTYIQKALKQNIKTANSMKIKRASFTSLLYIPIRSDRINNDTVNTTRQLKPLLDMEQLNLEVNRETPSTTKTLLSVIISHNHSALMQSVVPSDINSRNNSDCIIEDIQNLFRSQQI